MMAADIALDICILTPSEVTLDIVGSTIEGGRSLSGVTQSIDYSGGGFVAVTYGGINLFTAAQAKEWNKLAGCLNGSVRTVDVPLWADIVAARNAAGVAAGSPGGIANPTLAAAALGATTVTATTPGGLIIEGGEWFSIQHLGTVDQRAYRVWKSVVAGGFFTLSIMPPLRDAIAAGTEADFWRPTCKMRLPAGESMPWQFRAPGGTSELTVNFVEAF
jgi:hypothetical protein